MWMSEREEILEVNRWAFDVDKKLEHLLDAFWCDDSNVQLEATTQFRKLPSNSIERSIPITEVVKENAVPFLIRFLMREDHPQLQFEAAQALTLIASRKSWINEVIISYGAVPMFVTLLASPIDDVCEQAVRALGKFSDNSPGCRNHVLRHGALILLLKQLHEHAKLSMLRIATWTLSKFCEGKPEPPIDQMMKRSGLMHVGHCRIFLMENDNIQDVIKAGVCPRLVELLKHSFPSVLITALRVVGNIVTGDDTDTQCFINHQALPCLLNMLTTKNNKKRIKKEACWTISNITAGNKEQIQAIITANLIGPLVNLLQDAEFDIKKEAARAISNATSGGAPVQIKYLVSQGCIKPLCDLLIYPDPEIVMICLEALGNILKVGEADKNLENAGGVNIYAQMINDAEAVIEANLIGPLGNLLQNAELDIKEEAAWAIIEATSHKQKYLVRKGCIKPLCDLLIDPNPRIVMVCLEELESILKVGEADKKLGKTDVNIFAQMISDAEKLEKIESLKSCDNIEIYEKAVKILETYRLDVDDKTMPPVKKRCLGALEEKS